MAQKKGSKNAPKKTNTKPSVKAKKDTGKVQEKPEPVKNKPKAAGKNDVVGQLEKAKENLIASGKKFDKEPRALRMAVKTIDGAIEAAERFNRLHG